MEEYIKALKEHDWYYYQSDDHRVWTAGEQSRKRVQSYQKLHDPDFSVWNQYCHKDFVKQV